MAIVQVFHPAFALLIMFAMRKFAVHLIARQVSKKADHASFYAFYMPWAILLEITGQL